MAGLGTRAQATRASMVQANVVEVTAKNASEWLDQVVKLERKIFPKHESLATELAREASKAHNTLLVAVDAQDHDQVYGYLMYRRSCLVGHIEKLAVAEQMRRQGIGRTLVLEAVQRIKSSRAMSVTLMVDVKRKEALGLYKSVGFKIESTRHDYYQLGRHAYAMELEFE